MREHIRANAGTLTSTHVHEYLDDRGRELLVSQLLEEGLHASGRILHDASLHGQGPLLALGDERGKGLVDGRQVGRDRARVHWSFYTHAHTRGSKLVGSINQMMRPWYEVIWERQQEQGQLHRHQRQ